MSAAANGRTAPLTRQGVEISARGFTWQHAERDRPAIAGLDVQIPAGQKVLLLGPSGAGKSTFLHALAGVLEVDQDAGPTGELLVGGQDAFARSFPVGLMQQDPETQVVQSRVGDDVAFGAENLGVDPQEIRERIPQALDAVGLGALGYEHRTQELSGGQKQRLALAGILAMRPGLMLLDEPTANIDPGSIPPLRDAVIGAVESTGATLIVVEHRLEAWARQVDRVLVLAPGGGSPTTCTPRRWPGTRRCALNWRRQGSGFRAMFRRPRRRRGPAAPRCCTPRSWFARGASMLCAPPRPASRSPAAGPW